MKRFSPRLPIHMLFAALALCCAAYCGYQGLRLRHALRIDHAIALLDGGPREAAHSAANDPANKAANDEPNNAADNVANKAANNAANTVASDKTSVKQASGAAAEAEDAPPVQLARAVALARAGATEDAAKLYGLLIRQDRDGRTDAGRTARFDLGNLYLRAGLASRSADPSRSMPMIELAKQRYRDLLNLRPDDWDARYNLERALWAAPETGDESGNIASLQDIKRNALAPGMNAGDLP